MVKMNIIKGAFIISIVFLLFNITGCLKKPEDIKDNNNEASETQTSDIQTSFPPEEVTLKPSEDVKVTIVNDEYVMPMAELVTTKTNPDIIMIENKYIKISVIPNRGRLIFDYIFKPTGNSELYSNTKPTLTKMASDYIAEFGGYYLSIPWNPRDRQPYDLEYKLIKEGPDEAEVYLWGQDPINFAFVEVWITVERDSSLVQLETKVSNKTDKNMSVELKDYSIIAPSSNCSFIIPTIEVTVEESKDNWMGKKGDIISWPAKWSEWGNFEHFGSFSVSANKLTGSFFAIFNHDTGDSFVKLWEPADFFNGINIWSWGKDYAESEGEEATANFENYAQSISISSGNSINFVTYFYTLKDMQDMIMANSDFAGWLGADKQVYKIGNDNIIKIQSQLGSSKDYEDINLRVSLTDLNNNISDQLIKEKISAVSPAQLCNRSWEINLKDLKVNPGEYIFRLEISDNNDSLLFSASSLPVTIK